MTATTMDGQALARRLNDETADRSHSFARAHGRQPCLAAVLVGDDPASRTYVRMKANRSRAAGIESRRVELGMETTTRELVDRLRRLSADPAVDGILLQHPVPPQVDERAAFEAIDARKDVDGVTRNSFARLAFDEPGLRPCTPEGILQLLDAYHVELEGRHAVVVGRSPILGLPVGMLLLGRHATVTYCHSRTVELADQVSRADVLVAGVGRPELIRGEWIKPGAVVVDAGYNAGNIGDVDQAGASERASLLTPVPGGVGPMTIAVLLQQTVDAAEFNARADT